MAWRVGMKAVCISEDWAWTRNSKGVFINTPAALPIKGEVYTVTAVVTRLDAAFLGLAEFPAKTKFYALNFRPVRTTSISVFKQMLVPSPKKVRARA